MTRGNARQRSRVLRTHWRGVVYNSFSDLHPEVQDKVLAVLGLARFDETDLMKTSNRGARQAASLIDTWHSTLQAPSPDRLRAEAARLQPFCGSELTGALLDSDDPKDLRAALTLLRWQRNNGRAPKDVVKTQTATTARRPATSGGAVVLAVTRAAIVEAVAADLAEQAEEEERRRRQAAKAARARRREKPLETVSPEEPSAPRCAGCYGEIATEIAYTDREDEAALFCKSCAKVIYTDLRGAEAVAHRVSLAPEVEEKPPIETGEPEPVVVEAAAVEIAPEPAPGVEKPAEVAVVASPTEPKLDPAQAAAREEVNRMLENGLIRRRLTEAQIKNVEFLRERGENGRPDPVRALVLLQRMIEASVARPAAKCAHYGCQRPVWDKKGPFRNVHGAVDGRIEWADGKSFCFECRGNLIARTKRLLAERPTPPLERREPLAAKGGAGEREVKPAVVHATA